MTSSAAARRRLPRGRHGIPRDTVVRDQRDRILTALAEVMAAHGYAATSVTAVTKRAGVSRETFYEQFRSKEDCFEAAYERAVELLLTRIRGAVPRPDTAPLSLPESGAVSQPANGDSGALRTGAPMASLLDAYLDGIAAEPAYARLFLVEVYAAGPEAIARRATLQESFVSLLTELVDARTAGQRFACHMMVAALSSMVTTHIAAGDLGGLRALRESVLELVSRGGDLFGAATARLADPGAAHLAAAGLGTAGPGATA